MGVKFFRADIRTDGQAEGHDEANSRWRLKIELWTSWEVSKSVAECVILPCLWVSECVVHLPAPGCKSDNNGDDDESVLYYGHLSYVTLYSSRLVPTFRSKLVRTCSGYNCKISAVYFSNLLLPIYQATRCHNQ